MVALQAHQRACSLRDDLHECLYSKLRACTGMQRPKVLRGTQSVRKILALQPCVQQRKLFQFRVSSQCYQRLVGVKQRLKRRRSKTWPSYVNSTTDESIFDLALCASEVQVLPQAWSRSDELRPLHRNQAGAHDLLEGQILQHLLCELAREHSQWVDALWRRELVEKLAVDFSESLTTDEL